MNAQVSYFNTIVKMNTANPTLYNFREKDIRVPYHLLRYELKNDMTNSFFSNF